VLVFATGATLVIGMIFLQETFPPTILGKKARRLRKETGNQELRTIFEITEEGETLWHKVGKNLVRPAKLLTGNFIVFVLSLYMALTYGTFEPNSLKSVFLMDRIFIPIIHDVPAFIRRRLRRKYRNRRPKLSLSRCRLNHRFLLLLNSKQSLRSII
jgi:hypothetical protein